MSDRADTLHVEVRAYRLFAEGFVCVDANHNLRLGKVLSEEGDRDRLEVKRLSIVSDVVDTLGSLVVLERVPG